MDAVVVGAGVVGLAVGAHLARLGQVVFVLEAEELIGSQTSARNSEVIHASIYYTPGSLKARHCTAGREMLYAYAAERGIDHAKLGKFIVAPGAEDEGQLTAIQTRALENGAGDVRFVSAGELARAEPNVTAAHALYSPETGIVDSHALMLSLQAEVEGAGGVVALRQRVSGVEARNGDFRIDVHGADGDEMTLRTPRLVNAAGHGALPLSNRIEALDQTRLPEQRFAKGSYMKLSGKRPFSHLIYPMPVPGALGIHATLDLMGGTKFGPDIEWVEGMDLDPNTADIDAFYSAIRRYWPGLPEGSLTPDYAGVRPKIAQAGVPLDDFMIDTSEEHGLAGFVGLYGIESPGLTAALSIGAEVAEKLR